MTVLSRPARAARPAVRPAPRWAHLAAHTITLLALPSGIWRLGLALGLHLGYTEEGYRTVCPPGFWGPGYLVLLAVLSEGAALSALGLVQRWGEVVPRWIPVIGGRTIAPSAVLIPAWAGVAVLAVLWTPLAAWWSMPGDDMTPAGHTVVGFLYLPLVAWAPLLAALAVAYRRRRRREPARVTSP
ncbi:hypothetical protein AB0H37_18435 [Actinomadura sp. NPDC023710]|uniref:hypothetical protein n=1 Tax=Actinomadura sp. NPDC023710 TaxID=3158219 RepID=UPI00340BF373